MKKQLLNGFVGFVLACFFVGLFYGGIWLWYNQASRVEHGKIVTLHINIAPEVKNEVIQTQNIKDLLEILKEIQKYQSNNSDRFLTVSNLNSFYSSLFAAISVILIILGFFGWKKFDSLSQMGGKIEETRVALEHANRQVAILMEKRRESEWVKKKINREDNQASFDIKLDQNDQEKYDNMKNHLIDEHNDNAWREMFIAHKLVTSKETLKDFKKAQKIYNFIKEQNLLDECELEYRLYHNQGVLFWTKYEWLRTYPGNCDSGDNCTECMECLKKAKSYYENAYNFAQKNNIDCSQSKSNLAVVLIEEAKYSTKATDIQKCLSDAKRHLEEVKKKNMSVDFNYDWDLARVEYYADRKLTPLVERKILEAVKMIKDSENARIFYSKLLEEYEDPNGGFPGDRELLQKIRLELEQRLFIKC